MVYITYILFRKFNLFVLMNIVHPLTGLSSHTIEEFNHDKISAIENQFHFLPESQLTLSDTINSPVTVNTDYSMSSFHQPHENYHINTEIFDLGVDSFDLPEVIGEKKQNLNSTSEIKSQQEKNKEALNVKRGTCINSTSSERRTVKNTRKPAVRTNNLKEFRKEDLDKLDRMMESINEKRSKESTEKEPIESQGLDKGQCHLDPDIKERNVDDAVNGSFLSDTQKSANVPSVHGSSSNARPESSCIQNEQAKEISVKQLSSKKCTKCDKWFTENSDLTGHMKQEHANRYGRLFFLILMFS